MIRSAISVDTTSADLGHEETADSSSSGHSRLQAVAAEFAAYADCEEARRRLRHLATLPERNQLCLVLVTHRD
jgi:hypothetical protein